jgi:uncharacterized protein YndB with AHSA1/START domain
MSDRSNTVSSVLASTLVVACAFCSLAHASDRILRAEVVVSAPLDSVWKAWTTEEGVRSFFAPGCRIEPRVDGAYEIWFNPAGAPGSRGGDDLRVLALEPGRRLAFTWNAPPSLPYTRAQRTMVSVEFEPVSPTRTPGRKPAH